MNFDWVVLNVYFGTCLISIVSLVSPNKWQFNVYFKRHHWTATSKTICSIRSMCPLFLAYQCFWLSCCLGYQIQGKLLLPVCTSTAFFSLLSCAKMLDHYIKWWLNRVFVLLVLKRVYSTYLCLQVKPLHMYYVKIVSK